MMTRLIVPFVFGMMLVTGLRLGVADTINVTGFHQWEAAGGNGHWYAGFRTGGSGISWTDARDAAIAKGGYLATITSAEENAFVFDLINDGNFWINESGPWLGATDEVEEGNWEWVTDEPFDYTNWNNGEPNDLNDEDFLHFHSWTTPRNPTWNDSQITHSQITSYVVEFNTQPVPNPSSLAALVGLAAMGGLALVRRRYQGC